MNSSKNAKYLKRLGILVIAAAVFFIIMGSLLCNMEVNAKYGGSDAIIHALLFLVALGIFLIPLGIFLVLYALRNTAFTKMAAGVCAWVVLFCSVSYAVFQWSSHAAFAFFGLFGLVFGLPALILIYWADEE